MPKIFFEFYILMAQTPLTFALLVTAPYIKHAIINLVHYYAIIVHSHIPIIIIINSPKNIILIFYKQMERLLLHPTPTLGGLSKANIETRPIYVHDYRNVAKPHPPQTRTFMTRVHHEIILCPSPDVDPK